MRVQARIRASSVVSRWRMCRMARMWLIVTGSHHRCMYGDRDDRRRVRSGAWMSSTRRTSSINSSAYSSASVVVQSYMQPRTQDIVAEPRCVDPAYMSITVCHKDGWRGRYWDMTCDQVMVREVRRQGVLLVTHELAAEMQLASRVRIKSRTLPLTWVGAVTCCLSPCWAKTSVARWSSCPRERVWYVEVADDRELAAEQSQLVEHHKQGPKYQVLKNVPYDNATSRQPIEMFLTKISGFVAEGVAKKSWKFH